MSGKEVETVESLANGDHLHELQQAFVHHAALQCGFCTPGFLMESLALMRQSPRPSRGEVIAALSSNLCRCTGYGPIGAAVEECLDAIESPGGSTAIGT
jgi:carbon-monoxide dehydrogenase small subunit